MRNVLKYTWLGVSAVNLILLGFHWFGFAPEILLKSIIIFNVLSLLLSLPSGLMTLPVFIASNTYLEMSPFRATVSTSIPYFCFSRIMQWFWLINFWLPNEKPFQQLDLINEA